MVTHKEKHEEFVRNPFGCGLFRTGEFVLQTMMSLFLIRLITIYMQRKGIIFNRSLHFCIENLIVFVPMITSTTIWASYHFIIFQSLILFTVITTIYIQHALVSTSSSSSSPQRDDSPLPPLPQSKFTIYNTMKCNIIASTVALILAVDFSIFRREFAKTERFGIGIMDVGAIYYVALNAAVAHEIRYDKKNKGFDAVRKTFKTCLPIAGIGILRMVAVKLLNYQENVSEYGVHLNFFILLSLIKLICSLVHYALDNRVDISVIAFSIMFIYELLLKWKLSAYVQSNGPRITFIDQNKEGLLSIPNYVAFSLLFQKAIEPVHAIQNIRNERFVRFGFFIHYIRLCAISAVAAFISHFISEPMSRRNLNIAFLASIFTIVFLLIAIEYFLELLLIAMFGDRLPIAPPESPFLKTYSKQGLWLFIVANLLTGMINISMKTMYASTFQALCTLFLYICSVSTIGLYLS